MSAAASPRTAPGVRQLLPLPYGFVRQARLRPLQFLRDSFQRFGDVFRYRAGPFLFHLVSHPDGVRHVLQDHWKNYRRSWHYHFTKLVIGDGLVSTEGEVWRRQRQMLQPAFHHRHLALYARQMTDATADMLDRWRDLGDSGRTFDLHEELIGLTLRIVGRTLLGIEIRGHADEIAQAVATALAYLDYRIGALLSIPIAVPTPRNLRFRRAMRTLDRLVYGIIAERRRGSGGDDMLSMLLSLRDEETGEGMTEREIRDQVMTFIGAGHETTAVALAWTWYLLMRHEGVREGVVQEVATVLSGRPPVFEDIARLGRTQRAVQEALRLYPPVTGVIRDVSADDEIGGYHIPAGSAVILSPFVTHHHPAFWDEPDRFDPDRFLPERSATRPRFAYFPFLGGPHQCIGQDFAMMEATLITAMIAQRYRPRLAPGAVIEPQVMLSLRPRYGLPIVLQPAGA